MSLPSIEALNDEPYWYVIRTHPKQEDRVDNNLRASGLETFTPRIKDCRFNQYTGDPVITIKHLFPSYIFARFGAADALHRVRFSRGVRNVVSFGEKPAKIDDDIIDLIRSRVREDGLVKIGPSLKAGDRVVIKSGPLKSFTGVLESEMKPAERVMILLKTVSYQAHYIIQPELLEQISLAARA